MDVLANLGGHCGEKGGISGFGLCSYFLLKSFSRSLIVSLIKVGRP